MPGLEILAVLLACVLPVALLHAPFVAIALLGVIVPYALTHKRLEFLLCVTAFLIPSAHFLNTLRIPVGRAYLTVFQLLVLSISSLALLSERNWWSLRKTAGLRAGAALALAGVVSAVGAASPTSSLYWVVNVGLLLIALTAVLAPRLAAAPGTCHRTVVLFGSVLSVLSLIEAIAGRALLQTYYATNVERYTAGGPGFRPYATVGNPLVLSSVLIVIYAIALASPHLGRLRLPSLILLATAVLISLSRSSIILIALISIGHLLLRSNRSQDGRRTAALVSLGMLPILAIGMVAVSPRIETRSSGGLASPSDQVRLQNLSTAVDALRQHPLTGLGLGGYKRTIQGSLSDDSIRPSTVDNMYVTLLVETGLVGIVLICGAGLAAILLRRRAPAGSEHMRPGPMLPLIAFLGTSLAFETLYHDAMIFLFAFVLADFTQAHPADIR